jgi:hypothetical protein
MYSAANVFMDAGCTVPDYVAAIERRPGAKFPRDRLRTGTSLRQWQHFGESRGVADELQLVGRDPSAGINVELDLLITDQVLAGKRREGERLGLVLGCELEGNDRVVVHQRHSSTTWAGVISRAVYLSPRVQR